MAEDRGRGKADLLATSIRVSGLSEEELERRLGWSSGSVGRILEGEEDFDPEEVLKVLSELNGDAGLNKKPELEEPDEGQTQVVTDLLKRFRGLGYEARAVTAPEEELDISKLEKQVRAILREAFGKES